MANIIQLDEIEKYGSKRIVVKSYGEQIHINQEVFGGKLWVWRGTVILSKSKVLTLISALISESEAKR